MDVHPVSLGNPKLQQSQFPWSEPDGQPTERSHLAIQDMKPFILAFLLFVVLLVGYWAWPFVGLRALAADLQARNAAALSEEVDFGYLRRSLSGQIIATYLRITGRERQVGPLHGLAAGVGASIVYPWVSQIVNPENLVELLRGGTIQSELAVSGFLQHSRIAEFLFKYGLECLAKQQIWSGPFFDRLARRCHCDGAVPPWNAAVRMALEADRNRPARQIARSVRTGTG